ncbi:MAG: FAD-dependent oxidoreductase [Methylocystaceae bacterium]|nr:FAD-dependent oxidoreductase [Methylocystaceae bacterium]
MSVLTPGTVIVGASHAGVQVAISLRENGYDQPITLISAENVLPYQRPPLSKAYLETDQPAEALALKSAKYYADQSIGLILHHEVTAIDRQARQITLKDLKGQNTVLSQGYDHLVLATGSHVRKLPVQGAEHDNIIYVRTTEDADKLRLALEKVNHVGIIGAGFIGLEVATTAAKKGKKVSVIEMAGRILERLFPVEMSSYLYEHHCQNGIKFHFDTRLEDLKINPDQSLSLSLQPNDQKLDCDLLVVGIGTVANDTLAQNAGLTCCNGIMVDRTCLSDDPHISACGDCAVWTLPYDIDPSRTESVQNAVDQAKIIAARLCGRDVPAQVAPWFWSDQAGVKIQMVGSTLDYDDVILRGETAENKFSLLYYKQDNLVRVDSINRPADHLAARRLVTSRTTIPKEAARDLSVSLKTFG